MRDGRIVDTNRSLAKAGMILGWVFTGVLAIFVGFYVVGMIWLISQGYDISDY
jgi:hypothetical protein